MKPRIHTRRGRSSFLARSHAPVVVISRGNEEEEQHVRKFLMFVLECVFLKGMCNLSEGSENGGAKHTADLNIARIFPTHVVCLSYNFKNTLSYIGS
jgi:hypothetical protein